MTNKEIDQEINKLIGNLSNTLDTSYKDTLVLSGGGVSGILYTGVFKALDELNILKNITKNTRAVFITHAQGFDGLSDQLLEY